MKNLVFAALAVFLLMMLSPAIAEDVQPTTAELVETEPTPQEEAGSCPVEEGVTGRLIEDGVPEPTLLISQPCSGPGKKCTSNSMCAFLCVQSGCDAQFSACLSSICFCDVT